MTCPQCDCEDAVRVDHPCGRWMCSGCDQLYNGGGVERLAMSPRRTAYLARLRPVYGPPAPPIESFTTTTRRG